MIKLQVIGNLGKDCVSNNVNGKNVINFSVAHTERYKDATGTQKERTIWVECAYWTDRMGVAPYLKKGTQVYVEGAPDVRSYTTNDGRSGVSLTLRVLSLQLIGSRNINDQNINNATNDTGDINNQRTIEAGAVASSETFDDLPF